MKTVSASLPSLVELLRRRAQEEPDRLAFRFLHEAEGSESRLTLGDLDRRARAIGACLAARGATGQRALLLHPPGLEFIEALFGCLYAGVVAVPAYPPRPSRPPLRLRSLLADSRPAFALTTAAGYRRLARQLPHEPGLAALSWVTSDDAAAQDPAGCPPPRAGPDELALLQYTSGSTGSPRGVQLTHRNLLHNAGLLQQRVEATRGDRLVSWLPPYHDMGLIGAILGPLLVGCEATLLPPSTFVQRPLDWLRAISRFGGTVSGGPDSAYDLCVRRAGSARREALDLRSWRVAFNGAERVRPETMERFAAAFGPAGFRASAFSACYGLAEATLGVAFGAAGDPPLVRSFSARALGHGRAAPAGEGEAARALAASGAPLDGCEVALVDPDSCRRRAGGEIGEIWVRGPSVASGYWGQPELSARTFRARIAGEERPDAPGWLRTGDLGFVTEGQLFVTSRLKDLVILLGVNHAPEDLEATALGAHPRLRPASAAAFSIEDGGPERLVLVLEVDTPRELPAGEVLAAVRSAIAEEHELALHDLVLLAPGGVPRTSSGKVQRGRCRELYLEGELQALASLRLRAAAGEDGPAPDPALVEAVIALEAELLGVARLEPDEDFFAAGGHSLTATQLLSRVREELHADLPLRAVFEAPTPRALARRIARAAALPAAPPVTPVDRAAPLPLSWSQERMWFLHQLEPASSAYNVAAALAIDGPLDPRALEQALGAVVERHEVLRTNYPGVDGAPRATVAPALPLPLPLPVADLSADADPAERALALASELARTPFDLARDPLIRARLFRTGSGRHVLAVSLHHMVTDGWSMGLLLEELLQAYQAAREGRAPPARRPLQYADFAAWQRRQLGAEALRPHLAWWKQALAGAPFLELPTDLPRERRRSSKGGHVPLELEPELLSALRALAQEEGATLYMVLLAAFALLLHRYTGGTDLVLGSPVANRNRLPSEEHVGTLVNVLPLRLRVDPGATFAELLRATREVVLEAFAHQDLPFEQLVASLGATRRPGSSPLYSVLFDFQNVPMPAPQAGGLRLRPLGFSRGASQLDLSLFFLDTELGHLAGAEYSSELFEEATVRRLLGHYRSILEAAVADRRERVSLVRLLAPAEQAAILAQAATTCAGDPPRTPAHLLIGAQARRTPEAPAVVDADGALSYRELDRAVDALAARLRALGAGPGRCVAILLERSRALVVALLAALKSGAAYLPLDPRQPAERLGFILEDAQPALLLTEAGLRGRLALPAELPVVSLDLASLHAPPASPVAAEEADPDALAYLIYTSGSTGHPKGVEVCHGALTNLLVSMGRTTGVTATDRLLAVTTISFDIAALEIFLPLVNGARVHLASAEVAADGPRLAALLQASGATLMQATPSTWLLLLEAGWRGDGRLRMLCGGEALPRELATALGRGGPLWNLYGPTETCIWSTVHRVEAGEGPVPIGRPVDHTRVYVLDRHGVPVPPLVAGELFIGGVGVARGYHRLPQLTAERFVPDPFAGPGARMYRTGDAGRLRSDGALEWLGRLDQQVKVRGHRIEPGEIEAVLRRHPGVAEVAVVAREDVPGQARLVAYYVPAGSPHPEQAALREHCRRRLPEAMVPPFLIPVEALPLTPNGKLDRKALPPPRADRLAEGAAPVAPRDALEAELVGLWEETLGVPVPGVRHDFFDLGGHSLLAVRLLARIQQRTGVALPVHALLDGPTVEHLAALIRRSPQPAPLAAAEPFSFLVPVRREGRRAPLLCVHGAGGHVLNLHGVGRHLDADRPLYGLQARGLDGTTAPFATIEEMAAGYLAEARRLQPHGPYFLSGYCGGGLIAWEMAQQLRVAGEPVAILALIDCLRPGAGTQRPRLAEAWRALLDRRVGEVWRRLRARLARDLARTGNRLRVLSHRLRGAPVPYQLRDFWLIEAHLRAAARYRLRPYPGRVTVFRARDGSAEDAAAGPDLGWALLAAGGVAAYDVPGDHHSLLDEPRVQALAAQLDACLERAEPAGAAAGGPS